MLAVLAHQNVLNANKENYGMPLIYTYEQGFGVAYNDDEQTRMMLMPAISVNEQQRLSGTLTLLTMSSKSTQQPAALRLIEYCVEHLDEQTQYMMMPALNEPLREQITRNAWPNYKQKRQRYKHVLPPLMNGSCRTVGSTCAGGCPYCR